MIHWKTNIEMGEGFIYDELEHKEIDYNHLKEIYVHESYTQRTKYLIRDVWDIEQLKDLQEYLNEIIEEKEEDEDKEARDYEGGKEDYLYDNYVAEQLEREDK